MLGCNGLRGLETLFLVLMVPLGSSNTLEIPQNLCFFYYVNLQLEVDFAIGRDITPETVNRVTEVLQDW